MKSQTVFDLDMYQIAINNVNGPEAVAFSEAGLMYTANEDGRIIVLSRDGSNPYDFVNTGGRPLGLKFNHQGDLIVADAYNGLLSINMTGEITVLSNEYGGVPFLLTDDLDIASDGMIYFSDASSVYNLENSGDDWNQANGRLLSYNPITEQTSLLLDGLYFANGIALSHDESFVLVNETWRGHVRRYWLSGPNEGQTDIFANIYDNIGWVYVDNITFNDESIFWVATFNGPVIGLDTLGQIIYQFNFNNSLLDGNTSAIQYKDTLYLGALHENHMGIIPIPEEILSTSQKNDFSNSIVSKHQLNQNYPNPFNPLTRIRYHLPENVLVNIMVYNMLGNKVNQLVNEIQNSGYNSVIWDATNSQGHSVSAGVYLYSIEAGYFKQIKKMILLK
ncbi:MAG: SMP-30/gluconolactonase/LRE family protein [Candidatus Neomarinimicrobiota bacterium]